MLTQSIGREYLKGAAWSIYDALNLHAALRGQWHNPYSVIAETPLLQEKRIYKPHVGIEPTTSPRTSVRVQKKLI